MFIGTSHTLFLHGKCVDKITRNLFILTLFLGSAHRVWINESAAILARQRILPLPANSIFLDPIQAAFGCGFEIHPAQPQHTAQRRQHWKIRPAHYLPESQPVGH